MTIPSISPSQVLSRLVTSKTTMAEDKNEVRPFQDHLELFSPPRPTRMIQIEAPVPQTSSFDNNTASLPALAGEVALAQKNQMVRLEKRLEFLQQVKVQFDIIVDAFILVFR